MEHISVNTSPTFIPAKKTRIHVPLHEEMMSREDCLYQVLSDQGWKTVKRGSPQEVCKHLEDRLFRAAEGSEFRIAARFQQPCCGGKIRLFWKVFWAAKVTMTGQSRTIITQDYPTGVTPSTKGSYFTSGVCEVVKVGSLW